MLKYFPFGFHYEIEAEVVYYVICHVGNRREVSFNVVVSDATIRKVEVLRSYKEMLEPQTVLQNRYLITKQIGQGGMGAVYIATDQRFGSTVAVKETFFDDANLRKAFEREAKLLNGLRHSALPRVSDHFAENNGQFLVMEFIKGDDLGEMLEQRGGAFPVEQVLHWADQLLDALDYLHSHEPSVVHRDIKPQNLKLMSNGQIVLLDFGLAKGSSSLSTKATNTGSIFGYSRHYAPLEQVQGSGTDPRSDIYSLSATLYHLVTGIVPPDAISRATAVINGQADPLISADEAQPHVNSEIARVLTQAMSQNAAQRQRTAATLRAQLCEAANAVPTNGNTTNIKASAQTILDQDTKIMGEAGTGKSESTPLYAQVTVAMADAGKAEAVSEKATVAMNQKVDSTPKPFLAKTQAQTDSEVTVVAQPQKSQTDSGMNRNRYIGIAAGIILLLGISAVAYRYAYKSAQTETPVNQVNTVVTPTDPNTNSNTETTTQTNQDTEANKTSEQTGQNKPQNPQKPSKDDEKETSKPKPEGSTQTPETPKQPSAGGDDEGHSENPSESPTQTGKMSESERIEVERRQKEMQRRAMKKRLEQMRRRQLPPRP